MDRCGRHSRRFGAVGGMLFGRLSLIRMPLDNLLRDPASASNGGWYSATHGLVLLQSQVGTPGRSRDFSLAIDS